MSDSPVVKAQLKAARIAKRSCRHRVWHPNCRVCEMTIAAIRAEAEKA